MTLNIGPDKVACLANRPFLGRHRHKVLHHADLVTVSNAVRGVHALVSFAAHHAGSSNHQVSTEGDIEQNSSSRVLPSALHVAKGGLSWAERHLPPGAFQAIGSGAIHRMPCVVGGVHRKDRAPEAMLCATQSKLAAVIRGPARSLSPSPHASHASTSLTASSVDYNFLFKHHACAPARDPNASTRHDANQVQWMKLHLSVTWSGTPVSVPWYDRHDQYD